MLHGETTEINQATKKFSEILHVVTYTTPNYSYNVPLTACGKI